MTSTVASTVAPEVASVVAPEPSAMATTPPVLAAQPKRFTVQDYHRLVELGFLGEDDHIELIRGELMQMAAKGVMHEACIRRLLRQLPQSLNNQATLQCQAPIVLSFDGEPEPDFAVLRNREDDYTTAHPTPADILLVIEVADTSLEYDRTVKLSLYAEAAIPHYWLFNLVDRTLEAYSEPAQLPTGQFEYLNRRIFTPSTTIVLPIGEQPLALAQIFP